MAEDFVTMDDCARSHGVTRSAVHRAITSGKIAAEKFGRMWLIRREDCAAWQPVKDPHQRGKMGGRPKKRQPKREEGEANGVD